MEQGSVENFKRLFNEVLQTVESEWKIIRQVFPQPINVLHVFVQRIFGQSIQNFIEVCLGQAERKSASKYLDMLCLAHHETMLLSDQMIRFSNNELSEVESQSFISVVQRCVEDIFVQFIDNNRYITAEKDYMIKSFDEIVSLFKKFNQSRLKQQKRVQKQQMPVQKDLNFNSFLNQVTLTLNNVAINADIIKETPMTPYPLSMGPEATGCPTFETASSLISVNLESIVRCKELIKNPNEWYLCFT